MIAPLPREETLGRYRLAARLGRGGMAELFLGRLVGAGGFEKLVAIKRMLPHLSEDPQFRDMFMNEGRIAATLHHPNLCEVYELGEADGQLFLAMELLRGLPWSEIVAAIPDQPQAPLLRFVVGMLVQACEGLQHAHAATVVHRDVSPSNLMITTEGIVKLLDFGVSKVLTEAKRTQTGMLKGKLTYMAPEQIRNQPLDARSDIFSLGVIAWEAIAGRSLFDRPSDFEVFKAVIEEPIPPLDHTPELDAVIRRALSRDREERQPTARAFADELRRALAPLGDPMPASELQTQLQTWLGSSLARRQKELADLLARLHGASPSNEVTALAGTITPSMEVTGVHEATPEPDIRVRDKSVVIGGESLERTLEMPGNTTEPTAPRAVVGPVPQLSPPPDPPRVTLALPPAIDPSPAGWRAWLPVIALAVLAIATGIVVALWP